MIDRSQEVEVEKVADSLVKHVETLTTVIQDLTEEKDFYYRKLEIIERVTQEDEGAMQMGSLADKIQRVLYKS